ncbi:MAG: 2-polyprenyl-3-methyl-6-methoxy-1,4-benzoquinone monooxygenase [Gammaproteobacteria bacterium]
MLFPIHHDMLDTLIITVDNALRTLCPGNNCVAQRPSPAQALPEPQLSEAERKLAGRLLRVDHAGEVCAQALYAGHALTARDAELRTVMCEAATEENDHLVWCAERLDALVTHPSYLNPLWYLGALSLGVVSGLIGDKWSLGFVAETERQVIRHLDDHLVRLPEADTKSRLVLQQMRIDEAQHQTAAEQQGAVAFSRPVKWLMKVASRVMTRTAFWV